jgi:hypothetical protein
MRQKIKDRKRVIEKVILFPKTLKIGDGLGEYETRWLECCRVIQQFYSRYGGHWIDKFWADE